MLFILGMHRSGTSFLANLCLDLGLSAGKESDLLPSQNDNPEGFIERLDVTSLNESLLNTLGAHWFAPPKSFELSTESAQSIQLLRTQLDQSGVELIKDPRASLFIKHWVKPDDNVIIIMRSPSDVAESLLARDNIPSEVAAALWLIYNQRLARSLSSLSAQDIHAALLFYPSKEPEEKTSPSYTQALSSAIHCTQEQVEDAIKARYKTHLNHSANHHGSPATKPGSLMRLASKHFLQSKQSQSTYNLINISLTDAYLNIQQSSPLLTENFQLKQQAHTLSETHEKLARQQEAYLQLEKEHLALSHAHELETTKHKKLFGEYQQLHQQHKELSEYNDETLAHVAKTQSALEAHVAKTKPELEAAKRITETAQHSAAEAEEKCQSEHEKAEYLFAFRSQVIEESGAFSRSKSGWILYQTFRLYKLLALKRGTMTALDRIFRVYAMEDQRDDTLPPGRLSSLKRIARFIISNPGMAARNLTWHNSVSLLKRLKGNGSDFNQWIQERIPDEGDFNKHTLESYTDSSIIEFVKTEKPKVSILIPVYNHLDITLSLLKSIQKNTKGSYEVIIADDNSSDNTKNIGQYAKNIIHIRSEKNQGFLLNCNHASQVAKGEFLILLNNDTNVIDGWLDSLLETFDDPTVGISGPKILFMEGMLQEAGGIIWDDASGWNYGRLQSPDSPEYNYKKEVDYISGCCLMIRHKIWLEAGRFDERYTPARWVWHRIALGRHV